MPVSAVRKCLAVPVFPAKSLHATVDLEPASDSTGRSPTVAGGGQGAAARKKSGHDEYCSSHKRSPSLYAQTAPDRDHRPGITPTGRAGSPGNTPAHGSACPGGSDDTRRRSSSCPAVFSPAGGQSAVSWHEDDTLWVGTGGKRTSPARPRLQGLPLDVRHDVGERPSATTESSRGRIYSSV